MPEQTGGDQAAPVKTVRLLNDPLLRYGFVAGMSLAVICLLFTIGYFSYFSVQTSASFQRDTGAFLSAGNEHNLMAVLLARTAQNKALLQSCGVVCGVAFGFLGFSLFLLGIQGDTDAQGEVEGYTFSLKRLAPGSLIMIAAIVLAGVSASHQIELSFETVGGASAGSPGRALTHTETPSLDEPTPAAQFRLPQGDSPKP